MASAFDMSHSRCSDKKAQTIKDLDVVWDHFKTQPSSRPYSVYDTLLVDDSVHKAARQPFNHIGVSEYNVERRRSDLATTLNLPMKSASASFDTTLLALIGILDELKHEANVAKWIKECRIIPQELDADRNESTSTWYEDQTILQYWTEKGTTVAGRLGIAIEAGVITKWVRRHRDDYQHICSSGTSKAPKSLTLYYPFTLYPISDVCNLIRSQFNYIFSGFKRGEKVTN